jgi:hypothetical protein
MKKKNMNFYYYLNENDSLVFKPLKNNSFELFTKGEASTEAKVGIYENYRWVWEDENQRKLFFYFLQNNSKEFSRAFRAYWKSFDEKPSVWECAWRRFNIKVTKTKRKAVDSFYNTIYPMK